MEQIKHAVTMAVVKALPSGEFQVPASTETIDSDGESIAVKGWDLTRYTGKKNGGAPTKAGNPVVLYGHNYIAPPVGRATYAAKELSGPTPALVIRYKLMDAEDYANDWPATTPSPVALAAMLRAGFLKGHSVGFTPIEHEPMDPTAENSWYSPRRHLKQSLTEFSVVSLPSNPDSLHNALSKGLLTRSHLPGVYAQVVRSAPDVPDLSEVQAALEEELSSPRKWFVPDTAPQDPEVRTVGNLSLDEFRSMIREELFGSAGPEDGEDASDADEPEPQQRDAKAATGDISEAQAILIYQKLLEIDPTTT